MSRIFEDNSRSIGRTPLIRLNGVVKSKATVLVKVEGRNPSYSVKCRIGAAMIWDAEKKGLLSKGREILEATSGNTGIALAFAAAARGIPLTLAMPETMSLERRRLLTLLGAKLLLTPGPEGMKGSIRAVERLAEADPERYYLPQQFQNPVNPKIHEQTTGPEIWDDTGGQVDAVVAGVGTGGTLTGISRYIKKTKKKKIVSVAVEPKESQVLTQYLAGKPLVPGPHGIQGIGAGFIPETLDVGLIDRVQPVDTAEAIRFARDLARKEGILCGLSSGAAVAAAAKIAKLGEFKGKTMVVILPDAAERYLSTALFEGID